jgi:hypothetical protein
MRKIVPLLVVGFLILSSIGAVAIRVSTQRQEQNIEIPKSNEIITTGQVEELQDNIQVSEPIFTQSNNYMTVELAEGHLMMETGRPMLPVITKTYSFPQGTEIINVDVQMDTIKYDLSKKIEPSPQPVAPTDDVVLPDKGVDQSVYSSSNLYPSNPYDVWYTAGLRDDNWVITVHVKCYTQYSPANNKIYVPDDIQINIDYDPAVQSSSAATYDMLIITDEKFETALQPLVDHKNNVVGVRTVMETVQDILPQYSGNFPAEDIKLRIYDAVKDWKIKYVLLAGGHRGQTNDYYVPVFDSNNFDGAVSHSVGEPYDLTYTCDLYYADVYKVAGGQFVFETWDTNGNGKYAEGPYENDNPDKPDYDVDICVGRIPFRYSWEVPIVVDKIIKYETTADDSWFKKGVMVGGDTSPPAREDEPGQITRGVYEGELVCDKTASHLAREGFTSEKIYTSIPGAFTSTQDVIDAISAGCGFVDMQGHGNPAVWGNFLPDAEKESDFVYGFTIVDTRFFDNGYKLPVILLDGCHNGQFAVTMQQIIESDHSLDFPRYNFLEWVPTDTASWFLLQEGGGGIGVISPTALGYGYINKYITEGLGGWLMPRFAEAYADAKESDQTLGKMWKVAMQAYIDEFPIYTDEIDRKTIEERQLFGDPSLKIGGYQTMMSNGNQNAKTTSEDDYEVVPAVTVPIPTWEKGQKWTYKIYDIDFKFNELAERDFDIQFTSGDINVEVADVSDNYKLHFETDNVDAYIDIDYDPLTGEDPTVMELEMEDVVLKGDIFIDKNTLQIINMKPKINWQIDTNELLDSLDLGNLGRALVELLLPDAIPISINLEVDFESPYTILDFPLESDKTWILQGTTITLDGKITSQYLDLLKFINDIAKIFGINLVPPEFAKYLPQIDISDFMADQGIENEFEVPEQERIIRKSPFAVGDMKSVNVPAGTYNAYDIKFVQGVGDIYYAPEVENVVKIIGNLNDFIPIVDNIELELIK